MDGLGFIYVRGSKIAPGWYVACHRRSPPGTRPSVVHVYRLAEGDLTKTIVIQADIDSPKPEDPRDWRFHARIRGMDVPFETMKKPPRVELAKVIPLPRDGRPVRFVSSNIRLRSPARPAVAAPPSARFRIQPAQSS